MTDWFDGWTQAEATLAVYCLAIALLVCWMFDDSGKDNDDSDF